MYDIYKYCQVLRVDYTIRIQSSVTVPFEALLVPAPYQSTATYAVLRAYRGCRFQTSSGTNSMNKVTLRGTFYPSQVEGINTALDKNTWYIQSNNNATAPQDTDTHSVWWGVRPIDGSTTGSYLVQTTIAYHCHFFSPLNTVLSEERATSFADYDDDNDEPVSVNKSKAVISNLQKIGTSKMLKKV